MESEELLKQQALINRYQYQNKLLEQFEKDSERQTVTTASSYDPSSGLMKLSDYKGATFYGRAITNGAIGLNETIRLRDGTIPSYDGMPYKANVAPLVNKVQPPTLLIGFLARIEAGIGDRLGQVQYPLNKDETYLILGYLNNGFASIKKAKPLNEEMRFASYTPEDDNITDHAFSPVFNYYSIGFKSTTFRYFFYDNNVVAVGLNYDPLTMKMSMYDLNTQDVQNLNNFDSLSIPIYQTIDLTTTNIIINGVSYGSTTTNHNYFPSSTDPFGEVIKYKTSQGIVKYVALFGNGKPSSNGAHIPQETYGSLNPSGVLIWELGDLNNIPLAVTNPACYFGHSWKYDNVYAGDGTYFFDPVLCYGGYGADGGIVLNIETLSQRLLLPDGTDEYTTAVKGNVFIPENFLKGKAGTEIDRAAILGMMTNNPPPPLDTRPIDYQGNLDIDPALNLPPGDYKLFFYVSSVDQNQQIFV